MESSGVAIPAVPGVEPREAARLLDGGVQLIDVRNRSEFNAGHIAGARWLPLERLGTDATTVLGGGLVIVCCGSGYRSSHAVVRLRDAGFDAVLLVGGLNAWLAAGLTLVNARGRPGIVG